MFNRFLFLLSVSVLSVISAEEGNRLAALDDLTAYLSKPLHPHCAAFNFDIFDFPHEPGAGLRLEKVEAAGAFVDLEQDFAGKIVVLVEVNVKERHKAWALETEEAMPTAVVAYQRLHAEYADSGVEFLTIWSLQRKQSVEEQRAEALAYVAQTGLPGTVLLDAKKSGKVSRSKSAFGDYAKSYLPGHPPANQVLVRQADGLLVFKGRENDLGFSYHLMRHVLDRLLKPDYEQQVRADFPQKSRLLPFVEDGEQGLVYRDDFESYADSHTFKLEPRWGYTYTRQSRIGLRPELVAGAGRDGSQAVHVGHAYNFLSVQPYALKHHLPVPLVDGELSFYIRRGQGVRRRDPSGYRNVPGATLFRSFCIGFGQPESYMPAGHLMGTGRWLEETFVTTFRVDQPSAVTYAKNAWQQVRVKCQSGQKAEVFVDGIAIGRLQSESLSWFGLRLHDVGKTCYIDDVEVRYANPSAHMRAALADAAYPQYEPVKPFSDELQAFMTREYTPLLIGAQRKTLAEGHIPRADVGYHRPPFLTFDSPLPAESLLLENLEQPGQLVDVIEKHRGQLIWITRLRKGDHGNEKAIRSRTALRSPTVFNRVYQLAKEYKDKGVVIIGVAAVDGGHRDITTSYEERIIDGMETVLASQDFFAESGLPKNKIIYGAYSEVYDMIVGERFPNQLRYWNQSMRGSFARGAFAGMGADTIIDTEGNIVYRGSGPDGMQYWKARYVLDRLLDPDMEIACRQEFRNPELPYYRSPVLPQQIVQEDGLTYRDDFESYDSTYDFGLQPRWGFTYANYPNEHTAALFSKAGRDHSQAILLNNYQEADKFCGNKAGMVGASHRLPVPLSDGHIRFYIKRGVHVKNFGGPPAYRFALCLYNEAGQPLEALTTYGDWKKEHFILAEHEAAIKWGYRFPKAVNAETIIVKSEEVMDADAWQQVDVICTPEQPIRIEVDSVQIGELSGTAISTVEFRQETWSGTWLDDFEVFYRGQGEDLRNAHQAAEAVTLQGLQEAWEKEVSETP